MKVSRFTPVVAANVRGGKYANPFDRHIGINIERISSNTHGCKTSAVPRDTALNIHGTVHGGWLSANLDAVSVGATYLNPQIGLKDDEYGVTSSLNIEFKKPAFSGEEYICEAKVLNRQGNDITTEAEIKSDTGEVVALAKSVIKARSINYSPATSV